MTGSMFASFGRAPSRALVRHVAALTLAATMASSLPARAEPSEGGAAAAESLFQEARKLMEQKKYGEACPKLVASHKLAPAVGTLLNLADCYERDGKLASAWARFHEAIALAQRAGRSDRERTARERAEKLEPRLIRLSIVAKDPNVEVRLDGNPLDAAALGTPVPVDPGKHTVDATAKGKKPFTTTIEVSERTRTPTIEVPPLETDPESERKNGIATSAPDTEPPAEEPRSDGSTQRIIGLAAIGAGVVGVGVGAFFGLRTSAKWSEAQEHCDASLACDRTGVELAATAKNAGTVSTIAFIAGGVLLAGGAAAFFMAPPARPSRASTSRPAHDVRVGVGFGSVTIGGRF